MLYEFFNKYDPCSLFSNGWLLENFITFKSLKFSKLLFNTLFNWFNDILHQSNGNDCVLKPMSFNWCAIAHVLPKEIYNGIFDLYWNKVTVTK